MPNEIVTEILKVVSYAIPSFFISLIIHELGHVFTGLVNGWHLFILIIGHLKIYRESSGGKLGLELKKIHSTGEEWADH